MDRAPEAADIEAAKEYVGFKKLKVQTDPPALSKTVAALQLDLSAIAKGHGVDRVAMLLESNAYTDYFVEIGGEIRTAGVRADRQPWQVGIEAPIEEDRELELVLGLSGRSLATSGDYRNLFYDSQDGTRYSHTIDPETGRPARNELASVTAVADQCSWADGIATTMMEMGPERGMNLAEEQGWEVLFLLRKDGRMVREASSQFKKKFPGLLGQSQPNKG
jgi:thiamine biosynthesis lipoprotein